MGKGELRLLHAAADAAVDLLIKEARVDVGVLVLQDHFKDGQVVVDVDAGVHEPAQSSTDFAVLGGGHFQTHFVVYVYLQPVLVQEAVDQGLALVLEDLAKLERDEVGVPIFDFTCSGGGSYCFHSGFAFDDPKVTKLIILVYCN